MADLINTLGGTYGFGTSFLPGNDDGSTGAIDITPAFAGGLNLFGQTYDTIYINNNGNITFTSPLSQYTPEAIGAGYTAPIIAPFWGDVFTSNGSVTPTGGNSAGTNLVWYSVDPTTHSVTVTWDDVGYFAAADKVNAFQLVLTAEPGGYAQIEFIYQTVEWTTGSASGGSGGLGGTPARVGYSAGDGVHEYEIPASSNQAALLALPTTPGNTGVPGVYVFQSGLSGIYAFANPVVETGQPVAFGNFHVGESTVTQTVTIANTAPDPGESLDINIGTVTAGDIASGSIALLAAGQTDSASVTVGITTDTPGSHDGFVILDAASDGQGTSGAGLTPLAAQTIAVTGSVFAYAAAGFANLSPVLHVNDSGTVDLAVRNASGYGAFSEDLLAGITGYAGGLIAAGGTSGLIADGSIDTTSLTYVVPTGTAGVVSGTLDVALTSDGTGTSGLGQTGLAPAQVGVTVSIDNYATAGIVTISGAATLAQTGTVYAIDLGDVGAGDIQQPVVLGVRNLAGAIADLLEGSLVSSGDSAILVTGPGSFAGIGAQSVAQAVTLALDTAAPGTYAGTIVVDPTGYNASGYAGVLTAETIVVTGTVEPYARPQVNTASPVDFGSVRIGTPLQSALSISNVGSVGWQGLDAAGQASGNATVSGSIVALAAGAPADTADILVGLDAAGSGVRSGTVTLSFASDSGTAAPHPLPADTVQLQVRGTVYAEATGTVIGTSPVFHIGDAPVGTLVVRNAAPAPYSEALIGVLLDAAGQITATPATTGDIAPQATAGFAYGLPTDVAGLVTGTVDLQFLSDGTGTDNAGTILLGSQTVTITAAIDNYATAGVTASAGQLSGPGNSVTLDLGSILQDSTTPLSAVLSIENTAGGLADLLNGTLSVLSNGGFLNSGSAVVHNVAAGGTAAAETVSLPTGSVGVFTETLLLSSSGTNASGYVGTPTAQTITVVGTVQYRPEPELIVGTIAAPATALAGYLVPVTWTVTNQGDAAAIGPWSDQVFLASDAAGDNPVPLGLFSFTGTLAPGASVTRTESVLLPGTLSGPEYFVVRTDATDALVEHVPDSTKTTVAASPTAITPQPAPDIVVTSVTPPAGALSGQPTTVTWVVSNTGNSGTTSSYWVDNVYLSLNRTLDTSAVLLASVPNPSYLAAGQSYQNSATVTLPKGIAGPYYIIVYADVPTTQGAHGGTVIIDSQTGASTSFGVTLAPSPDLTVSGIITPAQDFSGQPVTVNWTTTNTGPGATDAASWVDEVLLSASGTLDSSAIVLGQVTHSGALISGGSYTAGTTVDLPAGISGSYTLFVVSDSNGAVFETGTAADHSASRPITVNLTPPPDLETAVTGVPAATVTAHTMTLSYTVTNAGSTPTPNSSWTDAVWLSPTPTLGSGAVAIGSVGHGGALDVGQSYSVHQSFTLPDGLAGQYYVIVVSDTGNAVFELDKTNNTAASAAPVSIAYNPVDLVVSGAKAPSAGVAGRQIVVSWKVANLGSGDTAGHTWIDDVVLSQSGTVGAADNIVIGAIGTPGSLSGGGGYNQTLAVTLPTDLNGAYKLFVVTDPADTALESNTANNAFAATQITVTPLPNLVAGTPVGPTASNAGDVVDLAWTVSNAGAIGTGATSWVDSIYLANAAGLNSGYVLLGQVAHTGALAAGASYAAQGTFTLPATLATGDYYFVVRTDGQGQLAQVTTTDDVAGSAADRITQTGTAISGGGTQGATVLGQPGGAAVPAADLSVSDVATAAEVASGQTLTVTWTESGSGGPTTGTWYDELYLSRSQVVDSSAVPLGSLQHATTLAAGASQDFSKTVTVPTGLSGPYYVLVQADASGAQNDPNRTNNTALSSALLVDLPAQVDLAVASAAIAQPGGAGTPISVTYTVDNLSAASAAGTWTDAVYLSTDSTWSVNDPLLGYVTHGGGIAAGGSYTGTLTAALPGLASGNYYAIVRTNVYANQPESDLTNNTGASAGTFTASLPQLTPGVAAQTTLTTGGVAYYQITVGANETIDFALASDNPGSANDIYIRYGAVPTLGQYDATSVVPITRNPTALIPQTQAGTYYVMVRDSAGGTENVSLTASPVDYSITGITPDQASNLGSVTLTIDGAKFNANEQVEIIAPNGTIRQADTVTWVNSGELWAKFDLQGLPVGDYSVAVQDATRSATLTDGFAVTDGPAGHLSVNLIAPSVLHTHNAPNGLTGTETGIVTIQYTNTGGTDIAAPIFDLSATGAEFAAGAAGLVSPAEVTILGASQSGPAGVLQPGATATVAYSFHGNFGYAQFITMTLSLGSVIASATPIDWASVEATMQPASIDDTDWNLIWTRFEHQVGGTAESLLNALSQAANTLSQIGAPTNDLGTLLNYELGQATGSLPKVTLTQATDLTSIGAAFDLSLARSYDSSLVLRNAVGDFGDGWTFTYDIKAITDAAGNVAIDSPAGSAFYTLNTDGSYTPLSADGSSLALVGGSYVLTTLNGSIETFRPDGQIGTIADANGNLITIGYDAGGHILGVTGSGGQSLSFTTNAAGEITSATDAQGNTVTYGYDASQTHLLSVTAASGTTSYTYDTSGNPLAANALTSVTDATGVTQSFTYDSQGSLASRGSTTGTGTVSYSYDGPGKVTETDSNGNATTLLYDQNGRLAEVQDADGGVSRLTYNAQGEITAAISPDGSTYSFRYDAHGDLTGYTDPLGNTASATYTAAGLLSQFTDTAGNVTTYHYSGANVLSGITGDSGSGTVYQYDAAGELTQKTDARGLTTHYTYNALGELLTEDFSNGTSQAYTYDARGNLLTATAVDGTTTTYGYDAAGHLTSVTDASGRVETYSYNATGQEIRRVEPDGSVTNYSYTAGGQIAQLTDGSGAVLISYTYDPAGLVQSDVTGNGAATYYSYDSRGDITGILTRDASGNLTSQLSYTYDSLGRPVTATSPDGTWTYSYDAAGQVNRAVFASTNVSVPDQDLSYSYDAAGNRLQTVFNGATATYTTNGLNQYTAADGSTYGYDADGNLVSVTDAGGTTTYAYDAQNELVSVTSPTSTTTYRYDALGNRVATTIDGVTTSYVIDPMALSTAATGPLSAIAQAYDAGGAVSATYQYGNGLVGMTSTSGTYYYMIDPSANVVGLTGANGTLAQSYLYSPFGTILSASGSIANPYQFAGGIGAYTAESGLVDMRARNYDPALGRFVSPDPTGLASGANLYTYVGNNPLTYVDPLGLWTVQLGLGGSINIPFIPGGSIPLGFGVAFDGNGNVSLYGYAGAGATAGASVDAGFQAAVSDAPVVGDLSAWFGNASVHGGAGYGGSLDYFTGNSDDGPVHGVGFTLGGAAGASASAGATYTWLVPIIGNNGQSTTQGVNSVDPNEIIGPAGYGPQGFIAASATQSYVIDFENASTATAPAQSVVITEQLDPNLDWRSIRLTGFSFDNIDTALSGNQAFYSGLLDFSATKGYDVQVTAGVNVATGLVTWTLQTIDPATGQAPLNPLLGFLPPDDTLGDGQGSVSYTIKANSAVQTGATVAAQATVIFDTNAPIDTPAIVNTLDAIAPTSTVAALPSGSSDPNIDVSWSGSDDAAGSGIASYTILVSEDGATPTVWLANTTRTNAIYTGVAGHSFAFSSIATDNAGNTEAPHATADASTVIAPSSTLTVAGLNAAVAVGQTGTADLTFVVTRDGDTTQAQTVAFAVTGSGANPATAADFAGDILPAGTVSFAAGDTTQTITIAALGNSLVQPDKDFTLTLSAPTGGAGLGSAITAAGTIEETAIYAAPTLSVTAIDLAARVGDSGVQQTLIIQNGASAAANQQALGYSVSDTLPAAFPVIGSAAGTIASGATASAGFGLDTGTAGAIAAVGSVAFISIGFGSAGEVDTALTGGTVALSGSVYAPAVPVVPGSLDFGIVHVGDHVTGGLGIGNAATGALTDTLTGSIAAVSGSAFGPGAALAGGIAAGSSGTLAVTLNGTQAGIFTGAATLALSSHDASLADLALTTAPVSLTGTVDNYATAAFGALPAGIIVQGGGSATIDLGLLPRGIAAAPLHLGVENAASGQADLLSGSFAVAGDPAFINSGLASFGGLQAGQSDLAPSVTLSTTDPGVFSETITLTATGSNASGYSGTLAPEVLTLVGTVAASYQATQGSTLVAGPADDVIAIGNGALTPGSRIDGGGGSNTLIAQGGGFFDLRAPAAITAIQTLDIAGAAPGQSQLVWLRSGLNLAVSVQDSAAVTIFGQNDASSIVLGAGNSIVYLGSAAETVTGGSGQATFVETAASAGATLTGNSGNDWLRFIGGGTIAMGSAITGVNQVALDDSDTVLTANGNPNLVVFAGGGSDTIVAGAASQVVHGGTGPLTVRASAALSGLRIVPGSGGATLDITDAGTVSVNPFNSGVTVDLGAGDTLAVPFNPGIAITGTGDVSLNAADGILRAGQSILLAGLANTLTLQGAGLFDLRAPAALSGIGTIDLTGAAAGQSQIVWLRDGLDATVNVQDSATVKIFGQNDASRINLGAGNAIVYLGSAAETVTGSTGKATIFATAATAGATIAGGSGATWMMLTGGGSVALGSNITGVSAVFLDNAPSYDLTANATPHLAVFAGSGSDSVTLGSGTQRIVGGAGALTVKGTAAQATSEVDGGSGGATLEITTGGTITLNGNDHNLTVTLDAASHLNLGPLGFITAVGAASGGDTIAAGGANQTLVSRGGNDTLIGSTNFGDTFRGTAAGLAGDTIRNFGGSDVIDITDLNSATLQPLQYDTGSHLLSATDGSHSVALTIAGSYTLANFSPITDGHTGTLIRFV